MYRQHTEEIDRMNRNTFREFLHNVFKMTDDILMDRIFKYFDTLNNGLITREEWILGLNIFLRGKIKMKTFLTFIFICSLFIEIECIQLPSEESIERAKRLLDINPVIDGYSTYVYECDNYLPNC